MFEIGDKIKCTDASIKKGMESFVKNVFWNWIKKDKEYTVRGFLDNQGIVTGILLEEIHNFPVYQPLLGTDQEPAFRMTRFVKTQSTTKEEYFSEENSILEEEFIKI
jgi:hypothetical protein